MELRPVTARARDTLRRPIVWLAMLTFYSGAEFVVAQWSFTLLTLHRGESVATGGLLVSLYWGQPDGVSPSRKWRSATDGRMRQ